MFDKVRGWLANVIAGDVIAEQLASVGATKVKDTDGWQSLIRERESEDRSYVEWSEDIKSALEAWRKNFLVRQIVRLTTDYVVGEGIGLTSEIPTVEKFLREWWDHDMNRMDLRLPAMCDELTRAGELFPVLFVNKANGLTYIRFIPARQIDKVDTEKEDLERELRYHRLGSLKNIQGTWWASPETAEPGKPVALHYAINRPIGAVRGEGDLLPILPWARRYSEWLKDRVRLNRARTESGLWDVTIEDEGQVEKKKKQYKDMQPGHGSVLVHGKGEEWKPVGLNIEGSDASPDGKAIRLAVASGAGIPMHFMGEGEAATKATAAEMGGPTFRHYRQRQTYFCWMLKDIVSQAYRLTGKRYYTDLRLKVTVPDIEERDNKLMAQSAHLIVRALRDMKAEGWVTDGMAVNLAFKFAGEILTQEEIQRILESASERVSEDGGSNGADSDDN
jgi:hypothetical protein